MKLRLPHLLRRLLTAAMTVTGVTIGTTNTQAGVMHEDVSIVTYTDFGQNKGRYTTTTNALLDYIRALEGGIVITYTGNQANYTISNDQGMISYASQTDNGAAAAVGYSYLATVEHNGEIDASFGSRYLGWENCVKYSAIEYRSIASYRNVPNTDYKVTRQSKIITDVTPSAVFTGDVSTLSGTLMYRAGAGTMYIRDAAGNQPWVMEAYCYIIGGINQIDNIWYNDTANQSYSGEWTNEYSADALITDPLVTSLGAGDSGSPVWIYNASNGQYEYLMASQAGNISTYNIARGAGEYTEQVIDADTIAVDSSSLTLYINKVSDTASDTITDGDITSFVWKGTMTNAKGAVAATFNGVKSGVNTWADLSGLKDTQNWYAYGEEYLNAVWSDVTDTKPLTFADLFHTSNVLFGTTKDAAGTVSTCTDTAYNIILTDTVDLGVGYAQFTGAGNRYTITSESSENNQFNHAGYVIDKGVAVHLQLTNPSDYMYEWRKTGEGDLYIDGSGDTNALLNLGGAGKTYLQKTGGHAAYNVLANNGTYVSIKDVTQIERDFTFGLGGATLDMNGNSMDWYYTAETAATLDDKRFSINALTEEAIITNTSDTTVTLTFKESGEQTYLGSFRDTQTGALHIVYDVADGSWTLNSIWTDLSNNTASGFTVKQGAVRLAGTNTVHAMGSAAATSTNRYTNALDWHYADATMHVSVESGATFELGSHARLTGNITVAAGGIFIMREGVQHAQEYIEGGLYLQDTADFSAFYGLKGNVTLESGATMRVAYNSGVTANNMYSGNISGDGNVSIDLGSADASFTLEGTNTFTGTKTVTQGVLIASDTEALGDTTTNKWVLGQGAVLAVNSELTQANALSYIDGSSAGTLALTEDMTDVPDMSEHTSLFIGAMEGKVIQYGTADDTLSATTDGKWNLGGGGGELVVNALLAGEGCTLVLGNGIGHGIVTLTNTSNVINSITFNGGVVLNFEDDDALGGASISLDYTSAMMSSADTAGLLTLVQESSTGAIMLDRAGNANVNLEADPSVALGSFGTTEYSGTITVAADAAYRFGGAEGKLVLTQALTANGTNALIADGHTYSGGVVQLNAVAGITGAVSVMGYDSNQSEGVTTGDMTLTFGVNDALAAASGTTVLAGGILDVGSTTQTLKNLVVQVGGVLKGNADGTLIFNMGSEVNGKESYFQAGTMILGKAEKIGAGELVLNSTNNSWDLFTIKEGTVFTRVDNALTTSGITRVENGAVLNLNTWDGDGFRERTMGGNIQLGNGGVIKVGSINDAKVTFNGALFVDADGTGTIEGGTWHVTGAANNPDGGTLVFNAPALHLAQTYAQSFGGTFDIASSAVSIYSEGSGDNMSKQFSHLKVDGEKTVTFEDATWNTVWQLDKLTGSGKVVWNSDTTHGYTARLIIGGDGAFSGTIDYNRNFAATERTHQSYLEISSEKAVSAATLDMAGAADSFATLALNADSVRVGGIVGDAYSHIMAGAAPASSDSTAAPASTRATNLIFTGSGEYTYKGSIGSASDTVSAAVSLTQEGSGTQTVSGTTVVLHDVTALSGTLAVSADSFTLLGDATVKHGATLKLGDSFTLGSGHSLIVQGAASESATFGSSLVLDGGELVFDASALSTDSAVYNLAVVGTATGTGTLNFSHSGSLGAGTYYLASGDWSGVNLTLGSEMSFLTPSISRSDSALVLTLSLTDGSNIWNGTSDSYSWSDSQFSTLSAAVTGTAVFNDSADYKSVSVTADHDVSALRFDSSADYTFAVTEGKSVTAANLYQVGTGSTTLEGSVTITTTKIENGSLVVTDTAQKLGSVSGDGKLIIDWGKEASGSLSLSDLGTLHIKSGSYGDAAATTATSARNIIVGADATYKHGSGSYTGAITSEGGTIVTNGGSLNGTMLLQGATTLQVEEETSVNFNSTLTQGGYLLTKTGAGTLLLNSSAAGVVLQNMEVQAGTLKYGSASFSAGTLTVAKEATLFVDVGANLNASLINLAGTLRLENGQGNYVKTDIVTSDGAVIRGTSWGSSSYVQGTLKGTGKLTLMGVNPWNSFTINSLIADAAEDQTLAIDFNGIPAWVSDDGSSISVTFTGDNTYSGGTSVTCGTLRTTSQTALGSGMVTMNGGSLSIEGDLSVSAITNTEAGAASTINLNGHTLTVNGAANAVYAGAFDTSTSGSIVKEGTGTQEFSSTVVLENVSVSKGTLKLTSANATIAGNIEVSSGGSLELASVYALDADHYLSVGGNTTLAGLILGGGVIALNGEDLSSNSALLNIRTATANITDATAVSILLAGGMPNVAGSYMLASGDWSAIDTSAIAVAVPQTFTSDNSSSSDFVTSLQADSNGLYLVLANSDSNIWAGDADNNTWSTTAFSVYGTSAVGTDATAVFDTTAANKSVSVTEAVSVGGMQISGGGYQFSGAGSISLSGQLSVTNGGGASVIDAIHIPTGPITVDASELTIVTLTPTTPSAPIVLSNAAKLTIGSADYRYDAFSGKVTGDAGSQLHLYTWQADGSNDHAEDGRVHLLADSSLQDLYIHGDLALNLFTNDSNATNLQNANLHMDSGSRLVVRSNETTLSPTTGNIVLAGDLQLQAYGQVGISTTLNSDFTLENGVTGNIIKTDTGSITLSGSLNVSGVSVQAGTLKLTGSSVNATTLMVTAGSLEIDNADATVSATGGVTLAADTSASINAQTVSLGAIAGDSTSTLTLSGGAYTFSGSIGGNVEFSGQSMTTSANRQITGVLTLTGETTVTGEHFDVATGGQMVLRDGAKYNRTSGSADWLLGTLTIAENATATFASVNDLHVAYNTSDASQTGTIELLSGSTLNLQFDSDSGLFTYNQAAVNLGANSTLNLKGGTTKIIQSSIGTEGETSTINLMSGGLYLSGQAVAVHSALTMADGTVFTKHNGKSAEDYTTLNSVELTGATATIQSTNYGGALSIGTLSSSNPDGSRLLLDFNHSADNFSLVKLGSATAAAGNFSGTITMDGSNSGDRRAAALIIENADIAKNAVIDIQLPDSATAEYAVGIHAANVTIGGLNSSNTDADGNLTTRDNQYSLFSGTLNVGQQDKNNALGFDTAWIQDAAQRTLTLNVAEGGDYTFTGAVIKTDASILNLVKSGAGTQTFSGVAQVGDIAVSGGKLVLNNTSSVVSGDVTVSGGTLDLDAVYTLGSGQTLSVLTGTENAVQLAGVTLAGGEIIFDVSLLSADTAALSVGASSMGTDVTNQTILLSNDTLMESGRYMLAAGNWAGNNAAVFTISGLTNGTGSIVTTDSGLYLDYVSDSVYTWDAGDGNWNYTDTNWDFTPDGIADDNCGFAADKGAVFVEDAHVTVSEAVSAARLTVRNEATLSLTETAALSVAAIEVDAGATLSFISQKSGYTAANISGEGTVELNLTNADNNTLTLGENFTGETYVKSGKVQATLTTQVGSTLRLADGVDMNADSIGNANGTGLAFDIVLEGATSVINGGHTHFYGTVSGDGTFKHGSENGYFTFHKAVNLGGLEHTECNEWGREYFKSAAVIDEVDLNGGQVHFEGNSTIGTLTLTSAASNYVEFYADATHEISSASIAGGTVCVNGATTIDTATISGGTMKFLTPVVGSQGGTITMSGGVLELNLNSTQTVGGASVTQAVVSKIVVNNPSATADTPKIAYIKNKASGESMIRDLVAVEIAANNILELQQDTWNTIWEIGDLSGAGNLSWKPATTHNYTSRLILSGDGSDYTGAISVERPAGTDYSLRPLQAFLELATDAAAQGALISLSTTNTNNPHNARTALAINTANATIQGLNGDAYAHLYAGASRAESEVTTMPASTAANTLTIAGSGDYTFAGTVGTADDTAHLNLAMTGSGTQTFSGEAQVGDIAVSGGKLVLSNASSVVSGDVTVNAGGSLTLAALTLGSGQSLSVLTGTENAVSVGALTLSGGELVFDAALLDTDTAALTLAQAAMVGEGGSAMVTLDFSNMVGALNSGSYMLAAGNWAATQAVLSYTGTGTATFNATDSGLYLVYTNDSTYTWVGGAEDSAWSSENWDLVPDVSAENNVSFVADKDAVFDSTADVSVIDAVSAGTVYILNGAQVSLSQSENSSSLSVKNLQIANGKLTLGSEKNWSGIESITIKKSGTLELAYGTGMNNADNLTEILLQGGTINLRNGGGTENTLNANITVDESGSIAGSYYGDGTTISGSITGEGLLNFTKERTDGGTNLMTVSAAMTDGSDGALAVNIVDANVVYSNAKAYTGGTTIGETATLTISGGGGENGALQGVVDVYGTLKLNCGDVTGWSSTKGVKVINVYDDGILNVNTTSNQTGAGLAINLQGGTMTGVTDSNFDLGYGGSNYGNSSINALAAADATAENVTVSSIDTMTLTLRQYTTTFDVAQFARLNISSKIQNNGKSLLNGESNPGSDTFTKTGLGELVLSGANTFTYATTVEAGTLTLANGGQLVSTVTVNEGATFKLLADTADVSYAKSISGTGTVVKAGFGTATLSAADLNLAALDVQAGFVKASGGLSVDALTVATGAGFAFDLSGTPAVVTAASYTGGLNFRLDNATLGSFDLFQGSADGSWTADNVTLSGYNTDMYDVTLSSNAGLVSIGVYWAGLVWNTTGATNAWNSTDANWNNAATATTYSDGSKVTFDGEGERVILDGEVAPADVVVRGTDYRFEGGSIDSSGCLEVAAGASLTLTQQSFFANGVTVDGTLGFEVADELELTFTGVIAGSGELNKTGGGTLNLGALNALNVTTAIKVSDGVLKLTGHSDETAANPPAFVKLVRNLTTTGDGKVLIEGDVVYNWNADSSSAADCLITIDDRIEITGGLDINTWGSSHAADGDGYRKWVLADGADLTVGGELHLTNKQKMVLQDGAKLLAAGGIKLGHDTSGENYTGKLVVEGGDVTTTGITFRHDNGSRTGNAFIMTGGSVEFAPANASTNVIQCLNDGAGSIVNGEVSLMGGTLVADESSWLMDAGTAANFNVYGVTFEVAADKSITLAGNIDFTPAEGAIGTITKTGAGLLVFNTQTTTTGDEAITTSNSVLAGLTIQGGWVQAQQAMEVNALTLAEGSGFVYDLSSTPAVVTAGSYTGGLNFRLDNVTLGSFDLFQGSADGSWTADNVTLSGYNTDMYDVTLSSNAGLVSISVAYAGLLWNTDYSETNTWVAENGETTWNGGDNTANVAYSDQTKVIFAGDGEEITISDTVTPRGVTVSGTGYAFVGEGTIAGTGKLTVETGADLSISTVNTYTGGTIINEGGTLTITNAQALGGTASDTGTTLGKLSGEGTLVINLNDSSARVFATGVDDDANLGSFTGTVDMMSGELQVGATNTTGTGALADFGVSCIVVRKGACFTTHFGYGANSIGTAGESLSLSTHLDLMDGSVLQNIDGLMNYTGAIRFNVKDDGSFAADGSVQIKQYWSKTLTFSGLLSGEGTVEMYGSISGNGVATYALVNESNTFNGTYKLTHAEGSTREAILALRHQNAAKDATIELAGSTGISTLRLDTDATIAALNSTDADNRVTSTTTATLTVSSGSFAGQLQNGSEANTLALAKQGSGTLTLSGANTYTGDTSISAGTLELTGAVRLAAASDISVASGATLVLNATNSTAMSLGNAISGEGIIHKKGSYETVLSGNVDVAAIQVKDGDYQATAAGTLTLAGSSVSADTLYAAYGQVNVGAETDGNTFMAINKVEMGDSVTEDSSNGLAIRSGSTLSITGNNSVGGDSYKQASFQLSEWGSVSTVDVKGKLLVKDAKVLIGDDAANINIDGGTMAVQGITHARSGKNTAITLKLSDDGTLILGDAGIDTYKPVTANLGVGTVGMSADTTTIAEDLTLTSAEGTTFDTTQYAFVTNADGVATDIVRGSESGSMTITGNIGSAEGVAAKMRVVGSGELMLNGNADLGGGLEVESGAQVAVGSTMLIMAADASNAATVEGAISISHTAATEATEATAATPATATIRGTGDTAATMNNSLITIAQGVSLTVDSMIISESSCIQGQVATYAARSAAATPTVTYTNSTIVLGTDNAETAGQAATLASEISLTKTGPSSDTLSLAAGAKTLSVTMSIDALSGVVVTSGSTMTFAFDYDSLFSQISLVDVDLLELSFAGDVTFDSLAQTTITGTTGVYEFSGYYLTPAETAVANVGNSSIYFDVRSIPEPTTTTLSMLALAALAARRRRK